MKTKILIIITIIVLSVLMVSCNEGTVAEPTNTPTQTPILTSTPTATPTKEPTPTPTATPNYDFDVSVELSTESFIIGKLDLEDNYLLSTPIEANTEMNLVDIDGDIYYSGREIYKIGKDDNIIDSEIKELDEILDLSEYFYNFIYGICKTNNEMYGIYQGIDYGQEMEPYYYYLINVDDYSINEKYNWKPEGYFGNKIVVRLRYDENYGWIKGIFDVRRNRLKEISDLEKYVGYYLREVVYATEDYFVIDLRNKDNYDDGKYIIVDMGSYDEIVAIDFQDLEVKEPAMYLVKEGIFYIFDEGNACIKSYNTLTGEVKIEAQFDHNCKFIKYEQEENSIYLQAYNYEYIENNKRTPEQNYVEPKLKNTKLVYFKYNLHSNEIEILNRVDANEYIKEPNGEYYIDICMKRIIDLKMGDYIFSYYISEESETQDHIFFLSKFKLGEEIDYDTWKD